MLEKHVDFVPSMFYAYTVQFGIMTFGHDI